MFCVKCGKEIQDNSGFCPHCGASVTQLNENSTPFGTDNAADDVVICVSANPQEEKPKTNDNINSKSRGKSLELLWSGLGILSFIIMCFNYATINIHLSYTTSESDFMGFRLLDCMDGTLGTAARMMVLLIVTNISFIVTGLIILRTTKFDRILNKVVYIEASLSILASLVAIINISTEMSGFNASLTDAYVGVGAYLNLILSFSTIIFASKLAKYLTQRIHANGSDLIEDSNQSNETHLIYRNGIKDYLKMAGLSALFYGLFMLIGGRSFGIALFSGLLFGALFSLAMFGVSRLVEKKSKALRDELRKSSTIICEGHSTYRKGINGIGGWLFLTESSLEFYPHKLNFGGQNLPILIDDISNVETKLNQLIVHTKTNGTFTLVVNKAKLWKQSIIEVL